MKINILTLFPEMFAPLQESMLGRAREKGILDINLINIRDYTEDKHNRVDDTPFGGGAGMVMQVQPILSAYRENHLQGPCLYMSPRGKMLNGEMAESLSRQEEITILCGHYEGVDQRALDLLQAEEVTIGDYILTGGELPAMVLVDTVARFLDGVLAGEESVKEESVYSGLLEYPHYTKPREVEGLAVPEVLVSGNHEKIDLWRYEKSLEITKERRPDLFREYLESEPSLSKKEKKILEEIK
ncbi:MAG: tRNA (guanosine(37)-N1)-methyltransferase TrmD [Clostridia bacterium]|uniref:tRNA (guanine-N(1)-)-methyltransferase n=1 Tax=Mogibacterium kristiansenii TaxID=2606708 RepID=A0A6N7X9U8_9FIRM|nr:MULTISPECIES: tRNA (guanosine(37)-N1)-methyltransferase TrmD [Mogibacterium]MDY5450317.1 tRNA (guanosine(37)-N1)-methyltransferase TrmD [Clostridia bacterium]MCI7123005.1 tRNA (guanosine(37)-N1)-methyltransferase TrmD [Mogibacterium sp.]MDD6699942.1 tRNA (guanosine(37)-N1)-methyltransferase TrmD [Mogibacterium kristiansenii]MEE0368989.1 tRNA (guanosine(37)-N1)-methyltransferase TrmD [Clostridia bacterium]MST71283.1 tRNA (guanosine(37)-N1)-methyltransferase TrmD [Mogibacterium kristiansenii]